MGKKLKRTISWIVGVFFVLSFVVYFNQSKLPSICLLISGILLLPPVNEYVKKMIIKDNVNVDEKTAGEPNDGNYNNKVKNYNRVRIISIAILTFAFFVNIPEADNNTQNNNNLETNNNIYIQEKNEQESLPVDASEIEQNEIDQAQIDASVANTITEKNGTYTGERVNGQKQGTGKYVWNNGAVYEGEFSNNNINGKGKLTIPEKGTYEGNFVDGKKNGQGTITFSNGDVYTGEWDLDKMSGQGKYTFANGDTYEGSFLENKFNGQGTYTKGENKYTGVWENNQYKQ